MRRIEPVTFPLYNEVCQYKIIRNSIRLSRYRTEHIESLLSYIIHKANLPQAECPIFISNSVGKLLEERAHQ